MLKAWNNIRESIRDNNTVDKALLPSKYQRTIVQISYFSPVLVAFAILTNNPYIILYCMIVGALFFLGAMLFWMGKASKYILNNEKSKNPKEL